LNDFTAEALIIGTEKFHFDEREVVAEALAELN